MFSFTERAKLPPLHYHCFQLQTMNLSEFAALNDGSRLYRNSSLDLWNTYGSCYAYKEARPLNSALDSDQWASPM